MRTQLCVVASLFWASSFSLAQEPIVQFPIQFGQQSLEFSQDAKTVLSLDMHSFKAVNIPSGTISDQKSYDDITGHPSDNFGEIYPLLNKVLFLGAYGNLGIYDFSQKKITAKFQFNGPGSDVESARLDSTGAHIAISSSENFSGVNQGYGSIFRVSKFQKLASFSLSRGMYMILPFFNPSGNLAYFPARGVSHSGYAPEYSIFNLSDSSLGKFSNECSYGLIQKFAGKGSEYLINLNNMVGGSGAIVVCDAISMTPKFSLRGYTAFSISSDRSKLIAADESSVEIYDIKSGNLIKSFVTGPYGNQIVDISQDSAYILVAGWGFTVIDANSGTEILGVRDNKAITAAKISPDGRYVAIAVRPEPNPATQGKVKVFSIH